MFGVGCSPHHAREWAPPCDPRAGPMPIVAASSGGRVGDCRAKDRGYAANSGQGRVTLPAGAPACPGGQQFPWSIPGPPSKRRRGKPRRKGS